MAHRQKPATAAWIQRERKRLGLSTGQLAERMALVGAKVGEQTISVWESYAGRNPSADNIDALERIFGSQAPEKAGPDEGTGLGALVAAIAAQTAAQMEQTRMIGELVSELRAARGLAPELRERVAAIEAYAEEHERRLAADRQLMGLGQTEDSPSGSPQPVEVR